MNYQESKMTTTVYVKSMERSRVPRQACECSLGDKNRKGRLKTIVQE